MSEAIDPSIEKGERGQIEHQGDDLSYENVERERNETVEFVSVASTDAEEKTNRLLDTIGAGVDLSSDEAKALSIEISGNTAELREAAEAARRELEALVPSVAEVGGNSNVEDGAVATVDSSEAETSMSREQILASIATGELTDDEAVRIFDEFERLDRNSHKEDSESTPVSETQSGFERKFLVKQMPDLSAIAPIQYERLFLHIGDNSEIRVQCKEKTGKQTFELEIKLKGGKGFERCTKKIPLSKEEYDYLKEVARLKPYAPIERQNYVLSRGDGDQPSVSIKTYPDGFARVEVEFDSKAQADAYAPDVWFGKEITGTDLALDSERSKQAVKN